MDMNYEDLLVVFGSKLKVDEFLYLFTGQKLLVRQGFYPSEQKKIDSFCKEYGLHCEWSDFLVQIQDSNNPFSNKGLIVSSKEDSDEQLDTKNMKFAYVSSDEKLCLLAKLFELEQNHHRLGELLGYPFCCRAFFMQHFSSDKPDLQDDFVTLGYLSLVHRSDDVCLLSHFPCSESCAESLTIAKNRFMFLKKNYPLRSQEIAKILNL